MNIQQLAPLKSRNLQTEAVQDCKPLPCPKLRSPASQAAQPGPNRPRWQRQIVSVPRGEAPPPPSHMDGQTWRNDGRCGASFPTSNGLPARCPTAREFQSEERREERREAEPFLRNAPCCSITGWPGSPRLVRAPVMLGRALYSGWVSRVFCPPLF
eukprot:s3134_g1.t1